MTDIQYNIIIIGGREVSRPYRVWFFRQRRAVFILLAMPPTQSSTHIKAAAHAVATAATAAAQAAAAATKLQSQQDYKSTGQRVQNVYSLAFCHFFDNIK